MGFLQTVRAELDNDPKGIGYAGMSNEQAADAMNDITLDTRERVEVPAYEVFEALDHAEWAAVSVDDKRLIQGVLSMGIVNVQGPNTRATFLGVFPGGSVTRSNLAALQTEQASRGQIIGVGTVHFNEIMEARAL